MNGKLLPALRPDLAVLLQPDIFNTSLDELPVEKAFRENNSWGQTVAQLLVRPVAIREWRSEIWKLIETPVGEQARCFIELATAVYALSHNKSVFQDIFPTPGKEIYKVSSNLRQLLRGKGDDHMDQFYAASVEFLRQLPKSMSDIPIVVLRALHDVKNIVKIEEQALSAKDQSLALFYLLQIARMTNENG